MPDSRADIMNSLTIGRLARSAGVGVETIRYYQRRGLLPTPDARRGAYRAYAPEATDRLRFIKRGQQLGFSLDEIASLLALEGSGDRHAIRAVAAAKLQKIEDKLADLERMKQALSQMICECESSAQARPCPIISALAGHPSALPADGPD